MAANKKPRKAYTRKPAGIPMTIRHDAESERELQLNPHVELLKLREGCADEGAWHTLVCRLNVGVTMAHQTHRKSEYLLAQAGLQAMREIWARYERTAKWGASGDNIKDIGEALVTTDNLQLSLTRRQLAEAIRYVDSTAAY